MTGLREVASGNQAQVLPVTRVEVVGLVSGHEVIPVTAPGHKPGQTWQAGNRIIIVIILIDY
jgi:hypothetical protein